jgi:predicted pyridoxine 5'-phosphate oxidase superfamily flavin-nucleotide-binding protein
MAEDKTNLIIGLATLEAIYGTPAPTATVKEIDYIHPHYRAFIEAAPFAATTASTVCAMSSSTRAWRCCS